MMGVFYHKPFPDLRLLWLYGAMQGRQRPHPFPASCSVLWSDHHKNVNFLPCYYIVSQKHSSIHKEQIERKKGFRGLGHAPGALFAGECEVGVSLISSTHERLAPVCLAATSLSVCFISACQALSGLLVLLLLLG